MRYSLFKIFLLNMSFFSWAMNLPITQKEIDTSNKEELSNLLGTTRFIAGIRLAKEITNNHYKNTKGTDWQFMRSSQEIDCNNGPQRQKAEMEEREDFFHIAKQAHEMFSNVQLGLLIKENFSIPVVLYDQEKYESFIGLRQAAIKKIIRSERNFEVDRANEAILEATTECAEVIDRQKNQYRGICAHLFVWAAVGWAVAWRKAYLP